MKKTVAFLLFAFLIISFNSCEKVKENTKRPAELFTVKPSIKILYKDNDPFEGKVEYKLDRDAYGRFEHLKNLTGHPDGNGVYAPGEAEFMLADKNDFITIRFTAYFEQIFGGGSSFLLTKEITEYYYYDDCKSMADENGEIIKSYFMQLPVNSDGTNY